MYIAYNMNISRKGMRMFKKNEDGYSMTTRLKMSLGQLEASKSLKAGDILELVIDDKQVQFYKNNQLFGHLEESDSRQVIKYFHNYKNALIQSIHPQFGVMVTINVSSLELPTLSLEEIDEKEAKKERRRERRYRWHDANRFTPFRFFLYLITTILSLISLIYAIILKDGTLIIMMGIVFLSSIYLVIDQVKLHAKLRNNNDPTET